MKPSVVLVSAGLVPLAMAASNVCSTGLLPLFAPLSTWPAAVSYCSSKYPGTTTTVTVTAAATLTTTTSTSTQTLSPTAPYKKRNARRKAAYKRFRERMEAAGLDPRSAPPLSTTTTAPPSTTTTTTTTTTTAPPTTTTKPPSTTTTTTTPPPTTTTAPATTAITKTTTTTAPLTTASTKATTTATSTSTTSSACGTGKAGLFCTLVAQASALVSEFCSCYDPAITMTSTTTVTPTSTITTTTVTTSQLPQQSVSCSDPSSLDPNDPFETTGGSGCTSFGQGTNNPVNCACQRQPSGLGLCVASYRPNEPCSTDADCPDGRHCLGYPDPNAQAYEYYCSNTQSCANGGMGQKM